jgi:hypothetical protein
MMAKISKDLSAGNLHPRETLFSTATMAAANAEIVIPCDGCSAVALDMRGTFSLTQEVAGTVDGTNWVPIVMRPVNQAAKKYVALIAGTVAGLWVGACAGYRQVRVRTTAWTSGAAVATLAASTVALEQGTEGLITTDIGTATGAAAAAVTLTLAAPGAGLRHYLTYLSINRFAAALLTAAATPVIVTTTNLPGTLAFSIPAEAAAQGTIDRWREDFAYPIASVAQNAATTIVCPATTGVIWRVTAGFYVAP